MKKFALIGAGGYVAPRHMKAIQDSGNMLIAALDKNDSVGIIDSYFPDAAFFTEFERFDRYLNKLKRSGVGLDYLAICSPNYLHDAHIRYGLRLGADVICEKPLVLSPWNLGPMREIGAEYGKNIYTILQLRLHPSIMALKKQVEMEGRGKRYDVEITYITSRGSWYYSSWKGDVSKSGGIATNIGIHLFDMLTWVFGDVQRNDVHLHEHDRASGYLKLEKANVKWFLSINADTLPKRIKEKGLRTFRSINIDDHKFEFSSGFTDLHTTSYEDILAGGGYGLDTAEKAIQIVYDIRNSKPIRTNGIYHPMVNLPLSRHPFEIEDHREETIVGDL